MASPVARARRRKRPTTAIEPFAMRRRMLSLAETSPFRRATGAGQPGELFGSYVVFEKLGEGGMSYVHRAELVSAEGVRKAVALKRLGTTSSEDPELVAAFVHEAQLASRLHHPNIAQAYDLGKIENTYYIAMELISGPTLAEVMNRSRGGGAIPLPIALEILIQICDALDHAHELCDDDGRPLELVHRDVSPMNVMISRTGMAKLIDFGIAKARSTRHTTEVGIIKGKHAYLAPEYTYGHLDHRVDIFGLGIVAHELITGRRLFLGDTDLETIRNVRHMPIPPPSRYAPSVSAQLDAIVLQALERDPARRWQTAGELRNALTLEARRLGPAVGGPQIRAWIDEAFQKVPRRDSSVDRMLRVLDPSRSIEVVFGDEHDADEPDDELADELDDCETIEASRPTSPRPITVQRLPIAAASSVPSVAHRGRVWRGPRWRPPTRWVAPAPRRSPMLPTLLAALVMLAAVTALEGWIDVDRWREIMASLRAQL